jgi:hypothetical protein
MVSIASACNRIARTRSTQVPSVPLTGDVRGLPGDRAAFSSPLVCARAMALV